MKKLMAMTFVAVCLFASNADAQLKLDVSVVARSSYLTENGFVLRDGPVSQLDFWVTLPYGFSVDFWGSTDFEGGNNLAREIDSGLLWANEWVEFGAYYYDFASLLSQKPGGDLVRIHGELRHGFVLGKHTVVPFIRYEYFVATKDTRAGSGWLSHLGVRHQWGLTERVSLATELRLMYDAGIFRTDNGFVALYNGALAIQVSSRWTVKPIIIRATAPFGAIDDREPEINFGAGVSAAFDLRQ